MNRMVDDTIAGEISWRRDLQYLIGMDNHGYHYCLQPHIDISRMDFTRIDGRHVSEEALMEIADGLQCPKLTIIGEDGTYSISASMITPQAEEQTNPDLNGYPSDGEQTRHSLHEEIPDTMDLHVFSRLTTEALRSMVHAAMDHNR